MKLFKWKKYGLIYCPNESNEIINSHAQVPVAEFINDDLIRVYFASRDKANRSRMFYIEIDAHPPYRLLKGPVGPLLSLGPPGSFDDSGIMPSWIVNVGHQKLMYYIGWNVRNTIPYHNSIGLAVSNDGGNSFEKMFPGPIIDRNKLEPYFAGTSCVLKEGNLWRNWYLSCTGWIETDSVPEPMYHIKYAESEDGVNWKRNGVVAIDYKNQFEGGLVKANVMKIGDSYSMWYSYRNKLDFRSNNKNSYRIGYAESSDGVAWDRFDDFSGIDISESGWDSDMIAYPHVIKNKNYLMMFYNGNGFGRTGIGLAISELR